MFSSLIYNFYFLLTLSLKHNFACGTACLNIPKFWLPREIYAWIYGETLDFLFSFQKTIKYANSFTLWRIFLISSWKIIFVIDKRRGWGDGNKGLWG